MEQGERALFVTQITGTHTGDLILPDLPIIPPTGTKISLPYRHLEYFVKEEAITTITAGRSVGTSRSQSGSVRSAPML